MSNAVLHNMPKVFVEFVRLFFFFYDNLQHLRVEENPILRMPHLEAASILLVGPTLKKFNDRGTMVLSILAFLLVAASYYFC